MPPAPPEILYAADCTVKSVNIHINGICNYRCGFCFARDLIHTTMTPEQWGPVFRALKECGIEKINFAGGEPAMHPHFLELCSLAKEFGFIVSVVTNGSLITPSLIKKMKGVVDWIGLSIDSPFNDVERELGRQCNCLDHIANVIRVAEMAHCAGIKVKLNITVVKQSWKSDFADIIKSIDPERVKVFQVVKIEGQNEQLFDRFSVMPEQWIDFKTRHECIVLSNGEKIVFEGGDAMIDSYLMIDPRGRIMRNSNNKQTYVDFEQILGGIEEVIDERKYVDRGALYDWSG